MLKILNIILITQISFFSLLPMGKKLEKKSTYPSNTNIDNLCKDIFEEILSYLLPEKFPNNKKDFIEKFYKNFANLRLVNKKLKNRIKSYKIINSFENELFKLIKSKNLNTVDEIYLALKLGSKKYFERLTNNDIKNFVTQSGNYRETKKFIQKALDNTNNRYPESLEKLIIKKIISDNNFKKVIEDAYKNYHTYFSPEQTHRLNIYIQDSNEDKSFQTIMAKNYYKQRNYALCWAPFQIIILAFCLLSIEIGINESFGKEVDVKMLIIGFYSMITFYVLYHPYKTIFSKKEYFTVNTIGIMFFLITEYYLNRIKY